MRLARPSWLATMPCRASTGACAREIAAASRSAMVETNVALGKLRKAVIGAPVAPLAPSLPPRAARAAGRGGGGPPPTLAPFNQKAPPPPDPSPPFAARMGGGEPRGPCTPTQAEVKV